MTALRIVNPDPRYAPVDLAEADTHGYVHLAAAVRPNPVPDADPGKAVVVAQVKEHARRVQRLATVERVAVFDAIAMPPIDRMSDYLWQAADSIRPARFDVVVLVETTSPAAAHAAISAPPFAALSATLQPSAQHVHVVAARAAKRFGAVDLSRDGLFLFDYFVAEDAGVMLALWDHLAGWYVAETGLDNSVLLTPLDGQGSDYVAINAARWDLSLPGFFARQLAKKTFRTYVHANLAANRVGAMPVLYRMA
jgi:hypothetical protein